MRNRKIQLVLMLVLVAATLLPSVASAQKKETYFWCCPYQSLPLFVDNDYVGLDLAAKELGVNVEKIGPPNIDIPRYVADIEQAIGKKPAGMMINGWDPSVAVAINKAVAAGIPVICMDADCPNSNRLAFLGSDWYQQGVEQAKALAPYLKGKKGQAVTIGIAAADYIILATKGYIDTLERLAPDVKVNPHIFDSQSNAQVVVATIANLIRSTPDLLAAAGFDSTCGPGIATAIKETGKVGQIYGTCVDAEAEHLQGVKSGALVGAVGQKRAFWTYYGLKFLYDCNHTPIHFTENDMKNQISPIPTFVATGFIVATKDNVDALMAAAEKRSLHTK